MAKRRHKNRVNQTGRNVTSRFARLDHSLLNSAAYRALSPNARSLLVELTMMENGGNNGSLWLSIRDAAARMGVADLTAASNAFDELQDMGFIQMTQDAHFIVKASETSRARCWRLTWQAGPRRKAPSHEYRDREAQPQTRARKRMERGQKALKAYRRAQSQNKLPVLDSNTMQVIEGRNVPKPVLESYTANPENGGFPSNLTVLDSATHTAVTMGNGATSMSIGWWQHDRMAMAAGWAAILNAATMERKAA